MMKHILLIFSFTVLLFTASTLFCKKHFVDTYLYGCPLIIYDAYGIDEGEVYWKNVVYTFAIDLTTVSAVYFILLFIVRSMSKTHEKIVLVFALATLLFFSHTMINSKQFVDTYLYGHPLFVFDTYSISLSGNGEVIWKHVMFTFAIDLFISAATYFILHIIWREVQKKGHSLAEDGKSN